MKLIFIFISIVSIAASGFFGVLTGVLAGEANNSFLMGFTALLVSLLLSLFSLRVALRLKPIKLLPILGIIVPCIVCGFAYDRILIPEGFKLIIIAIVLTCSGFWVSKSIKNNLKNK